LLFGHGSILASVRSRDYECWQGWQKCGEGTMMPTPELTDEIKVENRLKPVMIVVFSIKIAVAVLLLGNLVVSALSGPATEPTLSANLN
jgi:hypothetical protein